MSLKWSIGLMTGTVNDGYIDIAALRTDGTDVVEFGPFELFPYKDRAIKDLIFKTYDEARKWNFKGADPNIFTLTENKITQEQSTAVEEFINKYKINKSGFRTVFNTNNDAGQTVFHIHLHLIGGRKLDWPPG